MALIYQGLLGCMVYIGQAGMSAYQEAMGVLHHLFGENSPELVEANTLNK